MSSYRLNLASAVTILSAVSSVAAHGFVSEIAIGNQKYQGLNPGALPFQHPPPISIGWSNGASDTGFVSPSAFQNGDIVCHLSATPGQTHAKVEAGSTIELTWNQWPESHHGPVLDYMAKCDGECEKADKNNLKFFKIDEAGLKTGSPAPGLWASDDLIKAGNKWKTTIPASLAPGNYVLRHEIIALHGSDKQNGAQLYPQCINLEVTGSGTLNPPGIPATQFYKADDPGIFVSIYYPTLTNYTIPGPPVFTGAGSAPNQGSGNTPSSAASSPSSSSASAASASSKVSSSQVSGSEPSGSTYGNETPPASNPAPAPEVPAPAPAPAPASPVPAPAQPAPVQEAQGQCSPATVTERVTQTVTTTVAGAGSSGAPGAPGAAGPQPALNQEQGELTTTTTIRSTVTGTTTVPASTAESTAAAAGAQGDDASDDTSSSASAYEYASPTSSASLDASASGFPAPTTNGTLVVPTPTASPEAGGSDYGSPEASGDAGSGQTVHGGPFDGFPLGGTKKQIWEWFKEHFGRKGGKGGRGGRHGSRSIRSPSVEPMRRHARQF